MAKKILIMAGGTGGHVFPGIAIAKALQAKGIEVIWLGSAGGMETTLVPKSGLAINTLSITGFRRKSLFKKLLIPFRLIQAVCQAYKILKKIKPDKVLGMGGFVAAPGGIAAKLLGIPLFIHEQNSVAGLTNRLLSKIASQTLCAFPNTFPSALKAAVTGNPVREDIQAIPPKQSLHSPMRLLIMGGSRGAKIFNEIVPQAVQLLPETLRPEVYHQTGNASTAYYNFPVTVVPFIDDIATVYEWADIIICRAGALTLAELTTIGLPAILIPYPYAADDHQTANAKYLAEKNAAILLPQSALTPQKLCEILLSMPARYNLLAQHSRALSNNTATEKIIRFLV